MTKYVNDNGVSEMWTNTKNYISAQLLGKSDVGHTHSASDITSGLATVATSGSYNDLSNTPTIPTVNDATLTIQKNGTNVQTFTANQSTNTTANITVPTKTSDLTNDSGFITSDNTKIPLAGSNQISGSLIPATTRAYDLGSSSNYFGRVYTHIIVTGFINSNNNIDSIFFSTESSQARTFRPVTNGEVLLGASFARWKEIWCTQSSINSSSDERQKQQIKPIDNDLLNAWENVNPIEFKWNDAVKEKGDNARVHTGYIAQNIQQALTEKGVNPNDYGLFLYDEWGEEQEEKDEQGNIVRPYRPSGNAYGLRYTEALIVECAYLRKKLKELTARIEQLESSK